MIVSNESARTRTDFARNVGYRIDRLLSRRDLMSKWNELWSELRRETDQVLGVVSLSIEYFSKRFPGYWLTADPRVFIRFAPSDDRIMLNVWALLFHPPFHIAASLVHEEDHKRYHEETGSLGASADKQAEFLVEHRKALETRAFEKELKFLEAIRPRMDSSWMIRIGNTWVTYRFNEYVGHRQRLLAQLSEMKEEAKEYQGNLKTASVEDLAKLMACVRIDVNQMSSLLPAQPHFLETTF